MSVVSDLRVELDRFESLFSTAKTNVSVISAPSEAAATATVAAHEAAATTILTALKNALQNTLNEFEWYFDKGTSAAAVAVKSQAPAVAAAASGAVSGVVQSATVSALANTALASVAAPVAAAVANTVSSSVSNAVVKEVDVVAADVGAVTANNVLDVLTAVENSPYVASAVAAASGNAITSIVDLEKLAEEKYAAISNAAPSASESVLQEVLSKVEEEIKKII